MDSNGDPFLLLVGAVRAGDVERASALFAEHPELDGRLGESMPDSFGSPVLFAAAEHSSRALVELLLAHGADINGRSDWWAGSFGILDGCKPDFAPYLIERGAAVDAHSAARLGMLDCLAELVADDPHIVHARGGDGQTPLHFASTVDVAQFLLANGADMNAIDVDHESTPAQWMLRDRQDVARFLVTRGCRTDILMASALGAYELVRRHLDENPASIRTRVTAHSFPMRNARAGGTIYTWTLGGNKSAHVVARENGHDDVLRLLMERSPDELKLAQACLLGDDTLFETLLARRPNLVDSLSTDEHRMLVEALWNDNRAAVRMMLAAGWPVDVRGAAGETPLHVAAWFGQADIVRDLLGRGARLDVRDEQYHSTPLDWARHGALNCWRRQNGSYPLTEQLLNAASRSGQSEGPA
ncbi:MAG: ankyrin repeat protein [Gemmatimonadetes bacterium]|nr:ankyrin repeat protein [Gemmatimonadota bacterium]